MNRNDGKPAQRHGCTTHRRIAWQVSRPTEQFPDLLQAERAELGLDGSLSLFDGQGLLRHHFKKGAWSAANPVLEFTYRAGEQFPTTRWIDESDPLWAEIVPDEQNGPHVVETPSINIDTRGSRT
jgi:hypothetical protein